MNSLVMALRFYTSKELGILLQVSEETFHREIKRLMKKDFEAELKVIGVSNPDVLLDADNKLFLADPRNHNVFVTTHLSVFDYI